MNLQIHGCIGVKDARRLCDLGMVTPKGVLRSGTRGEPRAFEAIEQGLQALIEIGRIEIARAVKHPFVAAAFARMRGHCVRHERFEPLQARFRLLIEKRLAEIASGRNAEAHGIALSGASGTGKSCAIVQLFARARKNLALSSLPSAAIIRQRVPSTATLKFVGQTILRALGYLHYASDAGIIVTRYQDRPVGVGAVENSGAGRFTSAILRPEITVRPGTDIEIATAIHQKIHSVCFIARSVNFPVSYDPEFVPAD